MQLQTSPCSPIKVTVANGVVVTTNKMVTEFKWKMKEGEYETSMYVIPLGGMMQCWGFSGCRL